MNNWKTTLAAVGAFVAVIGRVVSDVADGKGVNISPADLGMLAAALGLWHAADSKKEDK